jgi:thioredoxin reductase
MLKNFVYRVKLFFHFIKFVLGYWKTISALEQAKKQQKLKTVAEKQPKESYDLIIIGCGPAGLAASIYAARQKLDFCVITENIGGQTNVNPYPIENYLGYYYITGVELGRKFEEHFKSFDIETKFDRVEKVKAIKGGFKVIAKKSTYFAKALIIATGRVNKILNVPGELKYAGRGVSFTPYRDAPLFKDKVVAVIGGGRSGLDAVSHLVNLASKIYLIEASKEIKHIGPVTDFVKNHPKVEIMTNTKVLEIFGDNVVKGIKVSQNGEEKKINVDGVFICIGYKPNTDFVKGLVKLNDRGEIIIDKNNCTSVEGIFAAGDCTDITEKQVTVAVGEGAKALAAASKYLIKLKGMEKAK